jgi:Tol biopolymer transport system component
VGLAACLTCLALTVSASTTFATFPGANGRIAFVAPGGIHTIRPDGSGNRLLVQGAGPSWSADGKRIAYVGLINNEDQIFTMRANGTDQRRLTHSPRFDGSPAYSPSGGRIAFSRFNAADVVSHVVSIRSDGSDLRVLAKGGSPTYSPSGRRIAYLGPGTSSGPAIWVMRRNGSHKRQLSYPKRFQWDGSMDYSPNGKRIIFSRIGRRSGNFVMRSDGSRLHRLKDCGPGTEIVYAPNGHKLAWTGASGSDGQGTTFTDIFTSTKRCADPFQVTHYGDQPEDQASWASGPSWQPLVSAGMMTR